MAITNFDQLVSALCNNQQSSVILKATVSSSIYLNSLWSRIGFPISGGIPSTAVVATSALAGSYPFTNPTDGNKTYLAKLAIGTLGSNATAITFILFDRLIHWAGLGDGSLKSVNTPALPGRGERSDGGDVEWYIEFYGATSVGSGAISVLVNYTDGVSNLSKSVTVTIVANTPSYSFIPILPNAGETIKSIDSVDDEVLGALTYFGITATRRIASITTSYGYYTSILDAIELGLPPIADNSCLFFALMNSTGTTSDLNGEISLIQG